VAGAEHLTRRQGVRFHRDRGTRWRPLTWSSARGPSLPPAIASKRIFGLYPRKGTIAVGSDADLVVLDPRRTKSIDARRLHSRAGYDPFEALQVTGVPTLTISRGEVIARDGELLSRAGRGLHLTRHRSHLQKRKEG
jgi:N-acyl-D-aspartate/D-glutamate deacylase